MKHIAIAASAVTILVGAYSFVHACKETQSAKAGEAATAFMIDTKTAEAFQITRVIHIRGAAVKHSEIASTPAQTVIRTAKVAATLGRAFVTTVGAVFGSLVDVAAHATASLV